MTCPEGREPSGLAMVNLSRVLGDVRRSATRMNLTVAAFFLAAVGCSNRTTTTPQENAFDPAAYRPEIRPFLLQLDSLVGKYNSEARGIELSEHGVDGHLNDAEARRLADFANAIIDDLNNRFDRPVARTIGDTWYQVPSRFNITEAEPHDGISRTFTVSHLNCGLHEYDFVVDEGLGIVVADRYDSLGINW